MFQLHRIVVQLMTVQAFQKLGNLVANFMYEANN